MTAQVSSSDGPRRAVCQSEANLSSNFHIICQKMHPKIVDISSCFIFQAFLFIENVPICHDNEPKWNVGQFVLQLQNVLIWSRFVHQFPDKCSTEQGSDCIRTFLRLKNQIQMCWMNPCRKMNDQELFKMRKESKFGLESVWDGVFLSQSQSFTRERGQSRQMCGCMDTLNSFLSCCSLVM